MVRLETKRLFLREVRETDLTANSALLAHPRQVRNMEYESSESSARTIIDWSLKTAAETPSLVASSNPL